MKRILVIGLIFTIMMQVASADTFSVQGVLRDPLGKTVEDGYYNITFKIYEQAVGGTAIWSEVQGSVQSLHGVITVELGSVNSLTAIPFDVTYWLGITVEDEPEMEPRFKLLKAPSAMSVLGTDNVFPSRGNIGAGTVTPTAALHVIADPTVTNDLLIEDEAGNPKLVVNNENNVGVGVSTPSAALHISNSNPGSDKLLVEGDGAGYIVIKNDGKMGVNTLTPGSALEIVGNLRISGGALIFDDGSLATATLSGTSIGVAAPNNAIITAAADDPAVGEIQFYFGSSEKAKITNEGRFQDVTGYVAPVGTITMFAGSTAPAGWVLCDGSLLSTTTYADLYATIGTTYGSGSGTFKIPDFRGRGPMGYNSSDGYFDTLGETGGAQTHTLSSSEMPGHNHYVDPPNTSSTTNDHSHVVDPPYAGTDWQGSHSHVYNSPATGSIAGLVHDNNGTTHEYYGTENTSTAGNHYHNIDIPAFYSSTSSHNHNTDIAGFNSGSTGSNAPHNNLQPYMAINFIIKY